MKLICFGEPGNERPGVLLTDGARIDTSGFRSTGVFRLRRGVLRRLDGLVNNAGQNVFAGTATVLKRGAHAN